MENTKIITKSSQIDVIMTWFVLVSVGKRKL